MFYINPNTPAERYLSTLLTGVTSPGSPPGLAVDTAFSVSLIVNFRNEVYTGRLIGNSDWGISLGEFPRMSVIASIGGSLLAKADRSTSDEQARLQSSMLGAHIGFTYSGNETAAGITVYVNGEAMPAQGSGSSPAAFVNDPILLGGAAEVVVYSAQIIPGVRSAAEMRDLASTLDIHPAASWSWKGSGRYRKASFREDYKKTYLFPDSRERKIDPGLYGGEIGFDLADSGSIQGPVVNGYNSSGIAYHAGLDRTYISTMATRGPGFSRDGYIGYYDHAGNFFRFVAQIPARTRFSADNHQHTPFALTKDGNIITAQEDRHCSTPRISRITLPDHTVSVVGDLASSPVGYYNLAYINTDLFLHCRSCADQRRQFLFRSPDDGQTWDAPVLLFDFQTGSMWAYPRTYSTGSRMYCVLHWRDQSQGGRNFFRMSCVFSEDGVNWTTINGQITRDITAGPFTTAEMASDGFLFQTKNPGGLDNLGMQGRWEDEAGVMHYIIRDIYDDKRYHVACDRAGAPVETPIPYADSPLLQRPIYLGGGAVECLTLDDSGGINRYRRGRTLDYWATPPEIGDFVTPDDVDLSVFIPALNHTPGDPYMLAGNYLINAQTESTGLWLGEYIIPPLP